MTNPQSLGDLLKNRLEILEISARDLSEKLGHASAHFSRVIQGIRKLQLEELPIICTALRLAPGTSERAAFERAAYLSHAPEEVRLMVTDLEVKLLKSEQESLRLSQTLAKLRQAMISAGIQVPEVDLDI